MPNSIPEKPWAHIVKYGVEQEQSDLEWSGITPE